MRSQRPKTLCRKWSYRIAHQVGSHVILETDDPSHHRLAVPDHRVLRIGTLNGILLAVAEHKKITREDIINTL